MVRAWVAAAAVSRLAVASAQLIPFSAIQARNSSGPAVGTTGYVACDALQAAGLGDRLLLPTDPGYEPQIATWFAINTRLRPYCLVLPQTSEEVATALTALVNANDGAGDWAIAVKSGGHGGLGTNNIASGVTIDLSQMNASSYDPETNIAKIQPGGRWKNVYADLDKLGVTVTGGRDGDVGVGGFLLGGGNSFFTGRMGFGCDSVVNFEVVLADGRIVNANNSTNTDLWKALKGGSSNFGIVTQFEMEALPSRDLAYDLRFVSSEYSDTVIDAVVEFTNQDQSLADNHLIPYWQFNNTESPDITIGCINVNTQSDLNAETAFNKVKALPAISNATILQSMAQAAEGSQVPSGSSGSSTTLFFRNDPKILQGCVEAHKEFVESLKLSVGVDMFTTMLFFQPLPSYIGRIGKQRGGNMMGLDAIDDNAILWVAGVSVDIAAGEAAQAVAQAETFAMTAKVEALINELDGDLGFRYLNYAALSQDPLGSYGAENIEHIRNVAAKYDPTGVFQTRIPGGFKISRVA